MHVLFYLIEKPLYNLSEPPSICIQAFDFFLYFTSLLTNLYLIIERIIFSD